MKTDREATPHQMPDMRIEPTPWHQKRWLLVLAVGLFFGIEIIVSNVWLGGQLPTFGVIPLMVVAWLYGLPGGLIAALVVIPVNFLFLGLTFQDPAVLGPLTIFLILLGVTVGRLSDVQRELKEKLAERDQAELKSYVYEKELRDVVSHQVVQTKPIAEMVERRICQQLEAVRGDLSQLKEKFEGVADWEGFQATEARVDRAIRDTRSLVSQLDPDSLLKLGFQGAIKWLAEQARESYGLSCELEDDGQTKSPEKKVALVILRAVRELLAIESRHAHGTQVKIIVRNESDSLQIILEGKGLGYDVSASESEAIFIRQVGLDGLKRDLAAVGGMLQIEPDEGRNRSVILAPLAN